MPRAVDPAHFGNYERNQLKDACEAIGLELGRAAKRNKQLLLKRLGKATDAELKRLEQALPAVGKRKRYDREAETRPAKRIKVTLAPVSSSTGRNEAFLSVPNETVLQKCMSSFIDHTGNRALARGICMVCARSLFLTEMRGLAVTGLPNCHLLKPSHAHPKHVLRDGMLLCEPAINSHGRGYLCNDCERQLKNEKMPSFSLANNLWIGDVPLELSVLTLPERVLIAKYLPTAYIVILAPKAYSARFLDVNSLNHGLRGNVSTYPLNAREIQGMVEDNIMPRPLGVLASTIGVTFVGPRKLPERMLPDMFLVRRSRVARALRWLQVNNPIYADLVICEERLQELPEASVPEEILQGARYSADTTFHAREHEDYVPREEETDEYNVDDGERPRGSGWIFRRAGMSGQRNEEHGEIDNLIFNAVLDVCSLAPHVIPLKSNGVVDIAGNTVPDTELAVHALSNTASEGPKLQKFHVSRGSAFINEYARVNENTGQRYDGGPENANHLLGSFPVLFPYGQGGFEVGRKIDVPYESHVRWALQYHDGRFRKDLYFPFQVFNIVQKRQVCRSATLQMSQTAFKKNERLISSLKPEDLTRASKEEALGVPFSNPAVRVLRQQLKAVRVRVIGTDESRISMRGKIWGTSVMHCPPSLWITINPSDTQSPIAQVLPGVEIDLDNFSPTSGIDVAQCGPTVSKDPYAAAQFFNLMITLILSDIMGISAGRGHVTRKTGIFGKVQSYVGAVESQGRGTLHLHMIVWLQDAMTSSEMKVHLQSKAFKSKVRRFIAANIHADLNGSTDSEVAAMPRVTQPSYCRPVDPRKANFKANWKEREKILARAVQYHTCSLNNCQRVVGKRLVCKRRAPFELADQDWISSEGLWGPKRCCGYLNNWNPSLLNGTGSNHDIKLITNGAETKDMAWYMTNYEWKAQNRSSNVSGLLAKRMLNEKKRTSPSKDIMARNRRLIQSCGNALLRDQEISGPMVMSLLMGWGDRYESHVYVKIYWSSAISALVKSYKELEVERKGQREGFTEEHSTQIRVEDGKVVLRNQLLEYQIRGEALKNYNFLEFMVNTYETSRPQEDEETGEFAPSLRSQRVLYQEGHGKDKRCRVVRLPGHATLPHFIGPWFPRSDLPEVTNFYSASMLMLLKPWRNLADDLKSGDESFEQAWKTYLESTTEDNRRIVDNIQYFHECRTSAKRAREAAREAQDTGFMEDGTLGDSEEEDIEEDAHVGDRRTVTEEDIEIQRASTLLTRDATFANTAMEIAMECGVFGTEWPKLPRRDVRIARPEELGIFNEWERMLRNMSSQDVLRTDAPTNDSEPGVVEDRGSALSTVAAVVTEISQTDDSRDRPQRALLNSDQRRAHDIIENHLRRTLSGERQEQLLMLVVGAGGTGKSLLISAITETFAYHDAREKLAKTASSGVAASLIGGQTLHSWAGIPIGTKGGVDISKSSAAVKQKRTNNIGKTNYLVHDEAWMHGKAILGVLSEITSQVKAQVGEDVLGRPFGGMNVIMFGDPHQFPPVRDPTSAMYCDRPEKDNAKALLGRSLYLQFTKVVVLKEQKRVRDDTWIRVLNHLRDGDCDEADLKVIRQLVLRNADPKTTDFNVLPWSDAVLVTSRHAVREQWNEASLMRHCAFTGERMYRVPAEDKHKDSGRKLSMTERYTVAGMKTKDAGKLTEYIDLAVGMKAMVVMNIATEAEVANGTRGTVTDIVLDPREVLGDADEDGIITLQYPPALIHFKPYMGTKQRFEGLPEGIVPITPSEATFVIESEGVKKKIVRRQLALTGGYAFTDYRAQGQTLEYVIVDLGKPPVGSLTPFSAYVALSRSRGTKTIRLLRIGSEELFTTHPSQDLIIEDERLRLLDIQTVV